MQTRPATEADAPAIREIYAPIVLDTHTSFETEVPTAAEMARRIRTTTATHPWLVAEDEGQVFGYAYAARHMERAAYAWSVTVSVYVAPSHHGRGVGTQLYRALFEELRARGFVNAFAGVALPNEASVGLHTSLGFVPVGTYRHVGFKHGRWHDTAWFQLTLRQPPTEPAPPT